MRTTSIKRMWQTSSTNGGMTISMLTLRRAKSGVQSLKWPKPYEIKIRKLKSARNALNDIIDRSASGKQAVAELKKLGFDYDTWAHAQVDIGSPSDFDILKRPKENDRISTGTTDTATSK